MIDPPHLEIILRLKFRRAVTAEYILRPSQIHEGGYEVECLNYWPSGAIIDHGTMSLEDFLVGVEKIRKEKAG